MDTRMACGVIDEGASDYRYWTAVETKKGTVVYLKGYHRISDALQNITYDYLAWVTSETSGHHVKKPQ